MPKQTDSCVPCVLGWRLQLTCDQAAPAPAPTASSSTTQDVTALVTSSGSLTTALVCPGVQAALPQVQDCTLISQEVAPQPSFSGSRRRLHQVRSAGLSSVHVTFHGS